MDSLGAQRYKHLVLTELRSREHLPFETKLYVYENLGLRCTAIKLIKFSDLKIYMPRLGIRYGFPTAGSIDTVASSRMKKAVGWLLKDKDLPGSEA